MYMGHQALRLRERSDHIELLAVQILLPLPRGIRNEDILHTGDQVSPTSQTVAGPPRATRRALNVPSALIVYRCTTPPLRRPAAARVPAMAFLQCQLSVLLSSAARLDLRVP
jgi:hypothetical protein